MDVEVNVEGNIRFSNGVVIELELSVVDSVSRLLVDENCFNV